MTTTNTTTTTTATKKATKKTVATLVGEGGRKLAIICDSKGGQFKTYITFIQPNGQKNAKGKEKVTRQNGATQQHATLADAIKATDQLVQRAIAGGWAPKPKKQPKTDAFTIDTIPAPRLVPVKPGQNMPVQQPSKSKK